MGSLVDAETGKAREGSVSVVDDATVRLTLDKPDITLIAGFSDYPAAIVHQSFNGDPLDNPIGTGPYLPAEFEVGVRAVPVKNEDHTWRTDTTDAAASMLRDAGISVKRTVLPGATFWNDRAKYPLSSTDWAQRPLGVQVLALAYKSGEAWNENAFANEEFDSLLEDALAIADADQRRAVMAKLQKIMQDEGVIIQPYWRSIYRHHKESVVGAGMHPTFEIHVTKPAFAA